MSQITNTPNEIKIAAVDASDAARLVEAYGSSPGWFRELYEFHRKRGVTTAEILAAMAASPAVANPLGRGRRRP